MTFTEWITGVKRSHPTMTSGEESLLRSAWDAGAEAERERVKNVNAWYADPMDEP